jgi:hypothetical protein
MLAWEYDAEKRDLGSVLTVDVEGGLAVCGGLVETGESHEQHLRSNLLQTRKYNPENILRHTTGNRKRRITFGRATT